MIFKVYIPGLHLSLGIFNRLWKLLENSCQELDFKRSLEISSASHSVGGHCNDIHKLSSLRAEIEVQKKYGSVLSDMLTYCVLTSNTGGTNELEDSLKAELAEIDQNIQIKVNISFPCHTQYIGSLGPIRLDDRSISTGRDHQKGL